MDAFLNLLDHYQSQAITQVITRGAADVHGVLEIYFQNSQAPLKTALIPEGRDSSALLRAPCPTMVYRVPTDGDSRACSVHLSLYKKCLQRIQTCLLILVLLCTRTAKVYDE